MKKEEKKEFFIALTEKIIERGANSPVVGEFTSIVNLVSNNKKHSHGWCAVIKKELAEILGPDIFIQGGNRRNAFVQILMKDRDSALKKIESHFAGEVAESIVKSSRTLLKEDKFFHEYILKRARKYEGIGDFDIPSKDSIQAVKKIVGRMPKKETIKNTYRMLTKARENSGLVTLASAKEIFGTFSSTTMRQLVDMLGRVEIPITCRISPGTGRKAISFIKVEESIETIKKRYRELYGEELSVPVQRGGKKVVLQKQTTAKDPTTDITNFDKFVARITMGLWLINRKNVIFDDVLKVLRDNTFERSSETHRSLQNILKKFPDLFAVSEHSAFIVMGADLDSTGSGKYGPEVVDLYATVNNEETVQRLKEKSYAELIHTIGQVRVYRIKVPNTLHTVVELSDLVSKFHSEEALLPTSEITSQIMSWEVIEKGRRFRELGPSARADLALWQIEEVVL